MELKEKILQEETQIFAKKKLLEMFPDLSEHRDRWGRTRLMSSHINGVADEVFMNHNCGCCDDSPLQAWPYKTVNGIAVFSNPTCFCVGEKYAYGFGDRPFDDWEKDFREASISEVAIKKIQEYFDENKMEDFDDDDDYNYLD